MPKPRDLLPMNEETAWFLVALAESYFFTEDAEERAIAEHEFRRELARVDRGREGAS